LEVVGIETGLGAKSVDVKEVTISMIHSIQIKSWVKLLTLASGAGFTG
jgi:hypothetical protein